MPAERSRAFAPGRVNLIGEHTDYNGGLALPFAIERGVTVTVEPGGPQQRIEVEAVDLGERDVFARERPPAAEGWRAYVRGAVAELARAGHPSRALRLQITGDLPQGAGLSSSAALTVALSLALTAHEDSATAPRGLELARLCARIENNWAGAETGLLDELACLYGKPGHALAIDFSTLEIEPVPLALAGWRLAVLDSGEHHLHGTSGYNVRRAECRRACELLGITSLSRADPQQAAGLPEPLDRRALHVLGENQRVRDAVMALRAGHIAALGPLLDASHESLAELYEVSTPAVEETVALMRAAGAVGARIMGGGFGGSVLGLFGPSVEPPEHAILVAPGAGAQLLAA